MTRDYFTENGRAETDILGKIINGFDDFERHFAYVRRSGESHGASGMHHEIAEIQQGVP